MRKTLIAKYHKSLAGDDGLTVDLFARLKTMMRERRLIYGSREISNALRPHFLTSRQYGILVHASQVVASALEKVALAFLNEPSWMQTVGLTEREIKLALVEPRQSGATKTSRLDGFVHGNEVKFVEYNAENPSSLMDQEGLNETLFEIAAMRNLAQQYELRQFSPARHLLNVLLNTFSEWGGTRKPNIAILDWDDLPTALEFVELEDFFARQGVASVICSPEQLQYENGKLRCDEFPIDLVYKRVVIHELLAAYDDSHPLLRAYVAGDVCLVNSFRCKLIHKKAAFELLTDEANASWFTAREREIIRRTVPWTRRVTQRKTHYHDLEVDLIEHIRKHRSKFVLKPNDDYGGRGVSFGDRATPSEWDAALSEALASDYVVQERVELRTEIFPIFSESDWALEPMYVDTNPFLFDGRVEGAMVRLSGSPVINVTSGGGEAGFFVIAGRR